MFWEHHVFNYCHICIDLLSITLTDNALDDRWNLKEFFFNMNYFFLKLQKQWDWLIGRQTKWHRFAHLQLNVSNEIGSNNTLQFPFVIEGWTLFVKIVKQNTKLMDNINMSNAYSNWLLHQILLNKTPNSLSTFCAEMNCMVYQKKFHGFSAWSSWFKHWTHSQNWLSWSNRNSSCGIISPMGESRFSIHSDRLHKPNLCLIWEAHNSNQETILNKHNNMLLLEVD